ncbi:hypothetical protein H310_00473 [Aphanomyces invadans]|uniref:Zinc/iron permease n=1 Tax=Aphanomyces invadans TaxID=157072 RepID=A0A024UWN9_9STRA|nr:hypothetical protein H310_00473 [Aphanomyces invadans]ETW10088.1 hypothetical protein H310_00473 [Aphanomyces invadans]|eukprot:XP_008861499.1 hypothetical protein H310_00473 [Aphanomyces invadans]
MTDIFWFNVSTCVLLLVLTIVFSLLPLFMSAASTESFWHKVMQEKLPFVTAGVFLSTGMIHLLPDAVKLYSSYNEMVDGPDEPYPLIYFLACMGCFLVWSVDSLNLGDSGKMMAVAAAAKPNFETSICRIHVPPITSYGIQRRTRTYSASDAFHLTKSHEHEFQHKSALEQLGRHAAVDYGTCSCDHTKLEDSAMIQRTKEFTEVDVLLAGNKCAVDVDKRDQCVSDPHVHAHVSGSVSEHIVFSGESGVLPYLLAALFSLHSLIAGFTLGMNANLTSTALATAVAIVSHKFIEAVSVGSNFAKARTTVNSQRSIAVLVTYSFMTPLGIVSGMFLSATLQGPSAVLAQAIALGIGSGSFIYLAFHEVSEEDAVQAATTTEKLSLFLTGLSIMAALAALV